MPRGVHTRGTRVPRHAKLQTRQPGNMPSSPPPTPYLSPSSITARTSTTARSATYPDSVSSHATHRPPEWFVHPTQCLVEGRQDLTRRKLPTFNFIKAPAEDACGPLRGAGYGLEGAVMMSRVRPMRQPREPSGCIRLPTTWGEPAMCVACEGDIFDGHPIE